jgi:hypothetical protein
VEEEGEEEEEGTRKEQVKREIGCLVLTDFCRLIPPDPPHYCIRPGSFFGLIASASILQRWIYSN